MASQYQKTSTGLRSIGAKLHLPLKVIPFKHDLGSFFVDHNKLYCAVSNQEFVVYEEVVH